MSSMKCGVLNNLCVPVSDVLTFFGGADCSGSLFDRSQCKVLFKEDIDSCIGNTYCNF